MDISQSRRIQNSIEFELEKEKQTASNFRQAAKIRRLQATIHQKDRMIAKLQELLKKTKLRAWEAELGVCNCGKVKP